MKLGSLALMFLVDTAYTILHSKDRVSWVGVAQVCMGDG